MGTLVSDQMQAMMADPSLQEQAMRVVEQLDDMQAQQAPPDESLAEKHVASEVDSMDKVVDNMIEGLFDYGLKATFAKGVSHLTLPQVPQSIVQPQRGFGLTSTSRLPHASPIASSLQHVDAITGKNTLKDNAVTAPRIQPKDVQDQEMT